MHTFLAFQTHNTRGASGVDQNVVRARLFQFPRVCTRVSVFLKRGPVLAENSADRRGAITRDNRRPVTRARHKRTRRFEKTICAKIAAAGVHSAPRAALVLCISNATLPPKWALHTYDEIYGVSSFESTCALLKFSSDQRVGSSPDIPNS